MFSFLFFLFYNIKHKISKVNNFKHLFLTDDSFTVKFQHLFYKYIINIL